ncbi:hypothetical protein IQ243_26815 [Nostocales cyanobacterium LEGE 11386]|nr:hypothetical protein [Nostocales cyanobacterium LEGE 11386]
MPKKQNCSELTAANLLQSLRVCGGSAPLHRIRVSRSVIQSLVVEEEFRIQNSGVRINQLGIQTRD